MQSVRDVLRQRLSICRRPVAVMDAIRAGCAEAKGRVKRVYPVNQDAIRAGCAEAKIDCYGNRPLIVDAIRAGCSEKERKVIVFKRSCVEQ